ncbi:hypothetical protein BJP40_06725 [Streptomyces sp. CC53]|uniref:hypothetical protein n=1 Tax=Streptomyces sp. CC53 TaxID=1906740 RepID=UPI0008DE6CC5|nr:hypothetical protein [Streptomyces sp. CC53]OII61215.1 hypothetical protein BJP40_06725 [Streptomyces sp. CC53]
MLDAMSSAEYTQWRGFERAYGPIDRRYSDEALANIHEQLQAITYLIGAQLTSQKKGAKNPVPQPKHFPRPHEVGKHHD